MQMQTQMLLAHIRGPGLEEGEDGGQEEGEKGVRRTTSGRIRMRRTTDNDLSDVRRLRKEKNNSADLREKSDLEGT